MRYTAITDNLELTKEEVKNFIKVDDSTDDDLIDVMIGAVKALADRYVNNNFDRVINEEVGVGDESTTAFTLSQVPIKPYTEKIYKVNLQLRDQDSQGVFVHEDNYTIDYTTGALVFDSAPDKYILIKADYRTASPMTIPSEIKLGCMQQIATWYEQRELNVQDESIDGLGDRTYDLSNRTKELFDNYRYLPGL
jgi:hypothetical protein